MGGPSMQITAAAGSLCALLCESPDPGCWGWETGAWGSALAITPCFRVQHYCCRDLGEAIFQAPKQQSCRGHRVFNKKHTFWSQPWWYHDSDLDKLFYLPESQFPHLESGGSTCFIKLLWGSIKHKAWCQDAQRGPELRRAHSISGS